MISLPRCSRWHDRWPSCDVSVLLAGSKLKSMITLFLFVLVVTVVDHWFEYEPLPNLSVGVFIVSVFGRVGILGLRCAWVYLRMWYPLPCAMLRSGNRCTPSVLAKGKDIDELGLQRE